MLTYAWAGYGSLPAFTGYPYLVTRIGACALRHLAIVPADWSRDRLLELLERQASTNQMATCLVLGPAEAWYVNVDRDQDEAAYFWDGAKHGVWYVAAYSALSHRCHRSSIDSSVDGS
jgi:hypothetical protein